MDIWNAIKFVTGGLTLVAFIAAAASLVYRRYLLHEENIVKSAPDSDRANIILAKYSGITVDVTKLTRDQKFQIATTQIGQKANQFKVGAMLVGFIAVLLAILAVVAIIEASNENKGKIEGEKTQLEAEKAQLTHIINDMLVTLDNKSTELFKLVKNTNAKLIKDDSVPMELLKAKEQIEQELVLAKAKIADYEKLYGTLPPADVNARLGQAEKSIQATKQFFSNLTLDNSFVERDNGPRHYRNRPHNR